MTSAVGRALVQGAGAGGWRCPTRIGLADSAMGMNWERVCVRVAPCERSVTDRSDLAATRLAVTAIANTTTIHELFFMSNSLPNAESHKNS